MKICSAIVTIATQLKPTRGISVFIKIVRKWSKIVISFKFRYVIKLPLLKQWRKYKCRALTKHIAMSSDVKLKWRHCLPAHLSYGVEMKMFVL